MYSEHLHYCRQLFPPVFSKLLHPAFYLIWDHGSVDPGIMVKKDE